MQFNVVYNLPLTIVCCLLLLLSLLLLIICIWLFVSFIIIIIFFFLFSLSFFFQTFFFEFYIYLTGWNIIQRLLVGDIKTKIRLPLFCFQLYTSSYNVHLKDTERN